MRDVTGLTTPIVSENLAQHAFDRIERAILSGDLDPGDTIAEADLARRLGISRGPLREALARLAELGLVSRVANQRPRITALSRDELVDFLVFREAVEGMTARYAAIHASEAEIEAMDALLRRHEKDPEGASGRSFAAGDDDLDFHLQVARASRNKRLYAVLDGPLYSILRLYRRRFTGITSRSVKALAEHRAILDAIRAHQPDCAEATMRGHIAEGREIVTRAMDDDETFTLQLKPGRKTRVRTSPRAQSPL